MMIYGGKWAGNISVLTCFDNQLHRVSCMFAVFNQFEGALNAATPWTD